MEYLFNYLSVHSFIMSWYLNINLHSSHIKCKLVHFHISLAFHLEDQQKHTLITYILQIWDYVTYVSVGYFPFLSGVNEILLAAGLVRQIPALPRLNSDAVFEAHQSQGYLSVPGGTFLLTPEIDLFASRHHNSEVNETSLVFHAVHRLHFFKKHLFLL